MAIKEVYNTWSEAYDSDENLTRDLDAQVIRQELSSFNVDQCLELGCGTGKNTAFLASMSENVLAIDFSEGMLKKAKEKVKEQNVVFQQSDINQKLPLVDNCVDLAVCNLVLEHIEDIDSLFREVSRILKPEGHFFICELHPHKQYAGSQASFVKEGQDVRVPSFIHHTSDFHNAALNAGLEFVRMNECWEDINKQKPPRLMVFLFMK